MMIDRAPADEVKSEINLINQLLRVVFDDT
jgi:hypothetical protein